MLFVNRTNWGIPVLQNNIRETQFFPCLKMHHFRCMLWHLRRKLVLIFFKWLFFSKLWWFHEPHNQVKCRWKNKTFSELYINKIFEYTFVTFECEQTIGFRCKYRGCQVLAGVVTGVDDPVLNFGLTLFEVKSVSDFNFRPEIIVRQVWCFLH